MATILVVDDRPSNRGALVELLGLAGHRVLEAGDGAEALCAVRNEHPDLVISDVVMPGVDGYQFALRLRRDPSMPQARVIFMSGTYSGDEDRVLAESCGVARFIAKPADPQGVLEAVAEVLAEPKPCIELQKEDERELVGRYQRLTANKLTEQVLRLEELEREIARRREGEAALHRSNTLLGEQALLDPLTGLFNRRCLEDAIRRESFRGLPEGTPLGVMMIDVDHFKRINDRLGHASGDAVLKAVARCMQAGVRDNDLLCRYGGEEFALLLAGATPAALRERAERLRSAVEDLRVDCGGGIECRVTVSIGIAMHPDRGARWSDALSAADAALYRAKRAGRNRVREAGAVVRRHAGARRT